ncbi:hypothetical protein [Plantactinospora sp. KBS50]|uniref:hypothetical protein n=1 Tax=Plantactinospora sp. KBS50 TaxID=2024580 RepID=UPI000BAAD820|nr:hypothetical protein [Plantactinospora sp. KBS50]ASW55334.1 hypothetical protein CIK06_15880 [Plantactinospora sp. KBS50]
MTGLGLLAGILTGTAIGVVGWLLTPHRRDVPPWLVMVAGVVGAQAGAIATQLLGLGTDGLGVVEAIAQAAVATLGVVVVAGTAGRVRSAAPVPAAVPAQDSRTRRWRARQQGNAGVGGDAA